MNSQRWYNNVDYPMFVEDSYIKEFKTWKPGDLLKVTERTTYFTVKAPYKQRVIPEGEYLFVVSTNNRQIQAIWDSTLLSVMHYDVRTLEKANLSNQKETKQ